MRVSTTQLYTSGIQLFGEKQTALAKYQEQIGTGKKISTPADDPLAAARILGIEAQLDVNDQYSRNSDLATDRLSQEESALNGVTESLQRIQELVNQGRGMVATSKDDRKIIADEIDQQIKQLVQLANYQDSNGEFIFAGSRTRTQPFNIDANGDVAYAGDQTNRRIQISDTRHVQDSDSGFDVFMSARGGNGTFSVRAANANTGTGVISPGTVLDPTAFVADTYTFNFSSPTDYTVEDSSGNVVAGGTYNAGSAINFNGIQTNIKGVPAAGDSFTLQSSPRQPLFTTVTELARAFRLPVTSANEVAKFDNNVLHVLTDLEQSMDYVNTVRSGIGVRVKSVESQKQANEDFSLELTKVKSNLQDVDLVEATSLLTREATALDVAQQAFARIQSMSLFNHLS